jgi:hypothetical protein
MFYVKDLITKTMLFFCQSNNDFYILSESSTVSIPKVYWSFRVSASTDI